MILFFPLLSSSFAPFSSWGTFRGQKLIDNNVNFMFHIMFNSLVKFRSLFSSLPSLLPSRLRLENTPSTSLQRDKTLTNECPGYDTKQSDGEVPVCCICRQNSWHLRESSNRSLTLTVLTSVLTELYNSSTSTQSPTRSLKSHVWSSSSGNNCHAVHRSLCSGASVYECTMGIFFTSSHFVS